MIRRTEQHWKVLPPICLPLSFHKIDMCPNDCPFFFLYCQSPKVTAISSWSAVGRSPGLKNTCSYSLGRDAISKHWPEVSKRKKVHTTGHQGHQERRWWTWSIKEGPQVTSNICLKEGGQCSSPFHRQHTELKQTLGSKGEAEKNTEWLLPSSWYQILGCSGGRGEPALAEGTVSEGGSSLEPLHLRVIPDAFPLGAPPPRQVSAPVGPRFHHSHNEGFE